MTFAGTVDWTDTTVSIVPGTSGVFGGGQLLAETVTILTTGTGETITATNSAGAEFGTSNSYDIDPGVLDHDTRYYWMIEAKDNYGDSTNSPIWTFRTEVYLNDPPNRPDAPDGPSFGRYLQSHTFTSSTTDPDGDLLYYRFDWDDGKYSKWIGPYESGRLAAASHAWLIQGSYAIKVQARDEHFALSEWSDPFAINMP